MNLVFKESGTFFATSQGKTVRDGLGDTVKCLTALEILNVLIEIRFFQLKQFLIFVMKI